MSVLIPKLRCKNASCLDAQVFILISVNAQDDITFFLQNLIYYTLLFVFTAFYADEAADKLILALRGVDEEIAYSMKWLYAQKPDQGKRIASCNQYADMWNARPALLEVASNNGNAQKQLCDGLQASRK